MDEMLFCRNVENGEMTLPLAIGRDENGRPLWLDLAAAPNILLAGCTKQGKSVAMNAMIASLCHDIYHRNFGICKNAEVLRWFLQVLFVSYVRGKWVLSLML